MYLGHISSEYKSVLKGTSERQGYKYKTARYWPTVTEYIITGHVLRLFSKLSKIAIQ